MKRYIMWWVGLVVTTAHPVKKNWTRQYPKIYSAQEMQEHAHKKELVFSKIDVPPFTQLLFSWNAERPKQGYYSFYVQVHSKKKKTWGNWHKAADWGFGVQRSYESASDGIARYVYVRLEVLPGDKADGFRIKVVGHTTHLAGIKSLAVNVADLTAFKDEHVARGRFPSVYVQFVPQKSQLALAHEQRRKLCSPTSCSMVLEYITGKEVDPLVFASGSYDNGLHAYGSWPFNMAHAYACTQGNCLCYTARLASFETLHDLLKRGYPVAVSVRGCITGAPKSYENGHFLVVVGYDACAHTVVCHDPAAPTDDETVKQYDADSFMKAWDRSRRLAYLCIPLG